MNKLAIRETFPPGIVGREIVLAQMCHHYRRISSAKARVDTNLFKPQKISLSRPLSAELASIVQRSLSPRSPPKHRRCLKYEHELGEHQIKPSARSQTAESRLRATPEVYHPAVKSPKPQHQEADGHQQGTQTSLENSLAEDEEPKTRDEAVQTVPPGLYRPVDARSVQFLRDITNEALKRRAFTTSSLNRIFLDHQFRNTYGLSQELMERELEELRRQLGMLPRRRNEASIISDGEALDALESLVLDPRIKEQVIHSLRLSRANDVKRPIYSYFDRIPFEEEEEQPMQDRTSNRLRETLRAVECFGTANSSTELVDEIPLDNEQSTRMMEKYSIDDMPVDGWDAEIEEDDIEETTTSSSRDEIEEDYKDRNEDEEEVDSVTDSEEESSNSGKVSDGDSEGEIEEVTQRESTSKAITDERTESKIQEVLKDEFQHPDDSSSRKQNSLMSATSTEITSPQEPLSHLAPLKLELAKGDKWKSSLEVVKEESDSTTGQVSDISAASTPTESESKQGDLTGKTTGKETQSSPTYHSAESGDPANQQCETENTKESSATFSGRQQDTSSSTGGEIVRQMDDLLADPELNHTRKADESTALPQSKDQVEIPTEEVDEDGETKSETGSEVESVHTDDESEDEFHSRSDSESDMESVHTD